MKGLLLSTLFCVLYLTVNCFARRETYTACGFATCELKVRLNKALSAERSHIVIVWDPPKPLAYLNTPHWNPKLLTYTTQYKIPSHYSENWHDVEGCQALNQTTCEFRLSVFHATYKFRVRVFYNECGSNCTSQELSVDSTSLVLMPAPDFDLRQVDDRLFVRHHGTPPGVQSLGKAHELYYQVQQNASVHRYLAGNSEIDVPIQNCTISSDAISKCCVRVRIHIPSLADYTLANSQWSEWRCIVIKPNLSDDSRSVAWVVLGLAIGFVTSAIGGFVLYRIYTSCRDFYKKFQKIPETLELILDDESDIGLMTTRGEPMTHETYDLLPLVLDDTSNISEQQSTSDKWIESDCPALLPVTKTSSRRIEFPRSGDPAYVTMTSVIAGLTSPRSWSEGSIDECSTTSMSSPEAWSSCAATEQFLLSPVSFSNACASCNHREEHCTRWKYSPFHDCTSQADSGLSFMHSTSSGASSSTETLLQRDSLPQPCVGFDRFSMLLPSKCTTHNPQAKRITGMVCKCDECSCACHSTSETRQFCTPNFSYVSSEMAVLGIALK